MKRNKFSLSHYKLATMDMGYLVPLSCYEVLPGDSIQQATSALIRVSPLLSPVMHPVRVRIHHWYVPLRVIWDDFEDFITGGEEGTSVPDHPYREESSITEGSLQDYLGIPPETYSPDLVYSALPERAYQLIYNENYRDQQLVTEAALSKDSGLDSTTSSTIKKVAWEKDYFTAARPSPELGDAISIPLTGDASIVATGDAKPKFDIGGNSVSYGLENANAGYGVLMDGHPVGYNGDLSWDDPKLEADLSSVSGVSISDLRLALAMQRYQEARNNYGTRYVEYLRYLGVRSSDARLQNPEYLGGGRQVISFSEVLQTGDYSGGDPVGTMRGHGVAALRSNRFRRFFEEHGLVLTLMSVVPKSIYTRSLHKSFSRFTKEDYFQKELQFIGDQAILNSEIQADHSSPDDVFGYNGRYDNYRTLPSTISGEFRSTLDHWHYAREFSGDVALNQSFIEATPTKRVNADTGSDCLYVMANHSVQARRMLAPRSVGKTF